MKAGSKWKQKNLTHGVNGLLLSPMVFHSLTGFQQTCSVMTHPEGLQAVTQNLHKPLDSVLPIFLSPCLSPACTCFCIFSPSLHNLIPIHPHSSVPLVSFIDLSFPFSPSHCHLGPPSLPGPWHLLLSLGLSCRACIFSFALGLNPRSWTSNSEQWLPRWAKSK